MLIQKSKANASAAAISVTLSGVAAGNFVPIILATNGVQTLNSIVDSSGDVVNAASAYTTQTSRAGLGIYFVQNAQVGTHTITATFAGTIFANLFASEYNGIATSGSLDSASPVSFGSGTALASSSIVTTQNADLIILALATQTNSASFSSYTNGFAQEDSSTTAPSAAWADLSQVIAGTIGGAATASASAGWAVTIAAFKLAPSQAESHFASPSVNCPF